MDNSSACLRRVLVKAGVNGGGDGDEDRPGTQISEQGDPETVSGRLRVIRKKSATRGDERDLTVGESETFGNLKREKSNQKPSDTQHGDGMS